MSDASTTGGEEQTPRIAQAESEPEDTGNKHQPCMERAWELLAEGVFTYSALANGANLVQGCRHDHHWAQRAIRKHSQMVAELIDDPLISHRAEYIQGLQKRRAAAARIANDSEAANFEKVAALKIMVDCDTKIAATKGVVTERKGMDLKGKLALGWWDEVAPPDEDTKSDDTA